MSKGLCERQQIQRVFPGGRGHLGYRQEPIFVKPLFLSMVRHLIGIPILLVNIYLFNQSSFQMVKVGFYETRQKPKWYAVAICISSLTDPLDADLRSRMCDDIPPEKEMDGVIHHLVIIYHPEVKYWYV